MIVDNARALPACNNNNNIGPSARLVVVKCQDANYVAQIFSDGTQGEKGVHSLKVLGKLGVGHVMSTELCEGVQEPPEFEEEHGSPDYQWLLDYEYRESFNNGRRDSSCRVLLEEHDAVSYDSLSRTLDANLAHIDIDEFRSQDIHHLLALPNMCRNTEEFQEEDEDEGEDETEDDLPPPYLEEGSLDEDCSGASGDLSLYQSGPLFSPLRELPQIPCNTFSVDSLDSESLHEDLILTCQANKDNYTIAFEGSFIQYSEESDFQETGESNDSGSWSKHCLEGRSPLPNMTHSDQPYTTWSSVSKRSPKPNETSACNGKVAPTPMRTETLKVPKLSERIEKDDNKSCSMPDLLKRSLMRQSLESHSHCVKVFDLQNSLRSAHRRNSDAANFSLVKLFMRQKSLSKEAVSLSSSCTEEGVCSSSDNQAGIHDSSDWHMNSQSESDMDGSSSPILPLDTPKQPINKLKHDNGTSKLTTDSNDTTTATINEDYANPRVLEGNLNNNIISNQIDKVDNNRCYFNGALSGLVDIPKENISCIKTSLPSPIREEPEGMDISCEGKCEKKVFLDLSEKEVKHYDVCQQKEKYSKDQAVKSSNKDACNKNIQSDFFASTGREESKGNLVKNVIKEQNCDATVRKRQDSGNSSSGYSSHKSSTDKLKIPIHSDHINMKPKPRPRVLKQMVDEGLQTSNLKVSATVNTSGFLEKKEIYIYYPNYALPDLAFLKDQKCPVDARVFLVPQQYAVNPVNVAEQNPKKNPKDKRPFSCGDVEKLRKHGFGHVKDWESLNFLLPKELKEMLMDDTECMETAKPSFCTTSKAVQRPASCEYSSNQDTADGKRSLQSQPSLNPSSGYRGSSMMLTESGDEAGHQDPRYIYRYDSTDSDMLQEDPPPLPKRSASLLVEGSEEETYLPPRPPLPRGILRKYPAYKDQRNPINKRHSAHDINNLPMKELFKRRSLPESVKCVTNDTSTIIESSQLKPLPSFSMSCSCMNQCTGFCSKGLRTKNLLRENELPDISAHEELNEVDLLRIRSQVSNFLVAQKGSQLPHNANTCQCEPCNVAADRLSCEEKANSGNPPNSPEISVLRKKKTKKSLESTSGSQIDSSRLVMSIRSPEDDARPLVYDFHDKKTLVLSVRTAVEKLVSLYSGMNTKDNAAKSSSDFHSTNVAQIVLEKLCPALYALFSDGLHPSLYSLFGRISNSVWRVVEATSQMGASTKALNDLVLTLNSEDCLSEGPIKFNAFIFGLLNIRSLDSWFSYIRTRESVIQKHYHPESFLYLANTATRALYDDLLVALRPLAMLPFNLDLLHEYKSLHASLLKMEERLFQQQQLTMKDSDDPDIPCFDQLRGIKETKEFKNVATQQSRVKALMQVLTSPTDKMTEENLDITPLLRSRSRSPRPRSCCEHNNLADDMQLNVRKRWSGIQFGSRLLTAIDKLMLEEIEGSLTDYTDSIDNPKCTKKHLASGTLCCNTGDIEAATINDDTTCISDMSTDNISEKSATDKDTENEKGIPSFRDEASRFRRLQLKWERMSEQPVNISAKDKSPGGTQKSKIPRPVSMTSPQGPFKPFEPLIEKKPLAHHKRTSLTGNVNPSDLPRPRPRRSLKDKTSSKSSNVDSKPPTGGHSRWAVTSPPLASRASSVPGRREKKKCASDNKDPLGSRSASQGRRVKKTPADMPRYVQTLHHRLAMDNGHLSFNRGEILTLVVEVDHQYLLCCHKDRKGLVPRESVVECAH